MHVRDCRHSSAHCTPAHQTELLLLHRGMKGVAFADALDKNKVCPVVPEYGMPEYDISPFGRLHASIPCRTFPFTRNPFTDLSRGFLAVAAGVRGVPARGQPRPDALSG